MSNNRVDKQTPKQTIKSRVDCGSLIASSIGTSTLCQGHPDVMAVCNDTAQAAKEVGDADKAVNTAQAALDLAEETRADKIAAFDATFNVCAAKVEQTAVTDAEILGIGLSLLEKASYTIAPPLGVSAAWDGAKDLLRIMVQRAAGMPGCVVDISTDPTVPASWQRLPGIAARPSVKHLTPGTYWIRAASVRGAEQSEFTTPIAVIVKPA